jgi:enoyl-CoA hydratase
MSYTCFDVDIEDHIAHIQLKRPEQLNSMIPAFWAEMPAIIKDISDLAKARVIVISSQGKHFCSGMDISVFAASSGEVSDRRIRAQKSEALRHYLHKLQDSVSCLDEARIPVLMAIQGGCVGGAVDLASAADCRYGTEDAFFCIQEINIGMTADVGTFPRLCHLIPQGMVRELAYTGRRLVGQRAKDIGFFNEIYESQQAMMDAVMKTAKEIAANAPLAVAGSKRMMNYARDHSIKDGLDYVALWQAGISDPLDVQESFVAKAEKREANYPGLQVIPKNLGE